MASASLVSNGSSPRGRGTHGEHRWQASAHRFIPARAGNTTRCPSSSMLCSVHPRAGGEHSASSRCSSGCRGSSPRGRGTLLQIPESSRPRRFIPARAGNTAGGLTDAGRTPVHPRAGGEHPCLPQRLQPLHRFIPARAGNTARPQVRRRCASVHPRAGGEHLEGKLSLGTGAGSSPRGRGTLGPDLAAIEDARFIPARAGNTQSSPSIPPKKSVHPRAGGEHGTRSR